MFYSTNWESTTPFPLTWRVIRARLVQIHVFRLSRRRQLSILTSAIDCTSAVPHDRFFPAKRPVVATYGPETVSRVALPTWTSLETSDRSVSKEPNHRTNLPTTLSRVVKVCVRFHWRFRHDDFKVLFLVLCLISWSQWASCHLTFPKRLSLFFY